MDLSEFPPAAETRPPKKAKAGPSESLPSAPVVPLFPEAEILAEAKAVKLFACSVSVKDTPLAVDAEVLNDFEGCYSVQLGFLSFPRMKARG